MNNFTVRITKCNEDIAIYTEVTEITIIEGIVKLCYKGGNYAYLMDNLSEIIIEPNR